MKILVVDPDEYYHAQYRQHLSEIAELVFARGVDEARERLQHEPDMIVMELIFSDGHAYDILPDFKSIPAVVFARTGHLGDIEAVLNLGAAAYFVKGQDTVNDIKRLAMAYSNET